MKKIIKFNCYLLKSSKSIFEMLWGLGIGDWGLGIGDWAQSPIPKPQSPIPNPQRKIYIINNFNKIKK